MMVNDKFSKLFACVLEYVSFYRIERVRGVTKTASRKFSFSRLQKNTALRVICEINHNTALRVRILRWLRAELAHA